MILICYDGSPDAQTAIERGGELLKGQRATVLTVWQTFVEVLARTPSGFGLVAGVADDTEEIDAATRKNAEDRAQEGVELAKKAGFDAEGRTVSQESSTAEAILSAAKELDATAILMGSRGLTGLKSLLVGSVSHGVLQEADRAVIIVPSHDVASRREKIRNG